MKSIFRVLLVFLALSAVSCSSRHSAPEHDVYEVKVNTFLNIRAQPSTSGEIVGRVENGDRVQIAEIVNGWGALWHGDGIVGYVSADYLEFREKGAVEASVNVSDGVPLSDDENEYVSAPVTSPVVAANVSFHDEEGLISPYERELISRELGKSTEFDFVIVTTPTVARGEIFDYAPEMLDRLCDEADRGMSWWQSFKSWFANDAPSDRIVLISYIREYGLLQAESGNVALKYIKSSEPETYFALQERARTVRPGVSIADMGRLVVRAGTEYADRSWFVRVQMRSGSIFDYLCDEIIVQNILPRDSFWHTWVFGWIFAVPFAIANFFFVVCGSYMATMILFMLLYVGLRVWTMRVTFTRPMGAVEKYTYKFVGLLLWLSITSLIVYMIPTMDNIVVMEQYGYAPQTISCAIRQYGEDALGKGWLTVVMFVAGAVLVGGFNKDYFVAATMPSMRQRKLFDTQKIAISGMLIATQSSLDFADLESDPKPYMTLFLDKFADTAGKVLGTAIPLSFVFSGSWLVYAAMYMWAKILPDLVESGAACFKLKRAGLYA